MPKYKIPVWIIRSVGKFFRYTALTVLNAAAKKLIEPETTAPNNSSTKIISTGKTNESTGRR